GLLGQVVEDDQDVLALVHPVLADGRAGVGGDVLEARRVGRRGGDDGGVLHRAGLFEGALDAGDGGALLADRDVDAAHLLARVARLPVGLLVDDGVDADRGLAGLPVTDDQLPLAATDGGHRVDGLDAGLHRLADRLPLHHGGGLELQLAALGGGDLALAVDRAAQRVHHAAEVGVAHRDGEDLAGAAHRLALLDPGEVAQDDRADLADLQVQGQAQGAVFEFEQLVRHRRGKAADTGGPVTGAGDGSDLFTRGGVGLVRLDETLQRVPDFLRPDRQLRHLRYVLALVWRRCTRRRAYCVA